MKSQIFYQHQKDLLLNEKAIEERNGVILFLRPFGDVEIFSIVQDTQTKDPV